MIIDLDPILNGLENEIVIDTIVNIPDNMYKNTNIIGLLDINVSAKVKRIVDNINFNGTIKGTMILNDDLTLDNIEYKFSSEIEDNIDEYITDGKLDLLNYIWQYILVEVPSKITHNNLEKTKGNGWQFIDYKDTCNYAFKDLDKLINERRD